MLVNPSFKYTQLLISFLLLNCFFCHSQENSDFIKIYLKDACEKKNITNAVVTLESYQKKPIAAQYDKKQKCYYFEDTPEGYNTIFVNHPDFEIDGFQKIDSFPRRINLLLNCKGNIIDSDIREEKKWIKDERGISHDTIKIDTLATGIVRVRDNYKVKISIKNSYKLSYNEVKRKIDSIVIPYGLEYIDDLVPNMLFVHINTFTFDKKIEQSFLSEELKKNEPLINLLLDPDYIFSRSYFDVVNQDPRLLSEFYYQLLYRKKDKSAFRGNYDLLLNEISEKNKNLQIGLMLYYKFRFDDDYPLKLNCKNLAKYDDRIMNYQFFSKYGNDPTHVLLMDKYFEYETTFLGKYELDMRIDGEVKYSPPPSDKKSNFRYVLELSKQ